jgi:hypothetical protein
VLNEEAESQRRFPMEHEHGEPHNVITPNGAPAIITPPGFQP